MGMPCEVNSILKLSHAQGYPQQLELDISYKAQKNGYRIIPLDVPILLVNDDWIAEAEVIIYQLIWQQGNTHLEFQISRAFESPLKMK